jgi:type III pantothenate kinase
LLLAVDVGNTHTVVGVFRGPELAHCWRLATGRAQTADELAALLSALAAHVGLPLGALEGVVVGSVVPPMREAWTELAQRHLGRTAVVVGHPVCGGLRLAVERPADVGADRIADAVAAWRLYGGPAVVVDCGTAIKVDAVGGDGVFLGGAIAPGLGTSYRALLDHTALLRPVELRLPERLLGRPTAEQMQAGLIYGFAGLVDALVDRVRAEMGGAERVVATGGWAGLLAPACRTVTALDPHLTLHGLRLVHEHWQGEGRRG